jgi:chemotaxis protein MotB
MAWAAGMVVVPMIGFQQGCVTKGKYEKLEKDFEQYRMDSEARDSRHQEAFAALEATMQATRDQFMAEEARLKALIDQLNTEKVGLVQDKTRMKAAEEELQRALRELQARKAQVEARVAEYRSLLARFKTLIDSGKLRVRISNGKMVVELATDVLFPSGSAQLSSEGRQAVMEVARVLATIPEREFQIEGHTDNVPIRTKQFPSNWELAYARANSVLYAMIEAGMPPGRISAASAGEFRPRVQNLDDATRAQNRRIEIIVVPDLSLLPGAEELEKLDKDS